MSVFDDPPAYTVEVRENGERLALTPIHDPFIRTTIIVKPSWRSIWWLVRRRLRFEVHVDATSERVANVMRITNADDARVAAERRQPPVTMALDDNQTEAPRG